MKLDCIVIEDDVIQRMINVKLVNSHPNLNVVGSFSNAKEAKDFISKNSVDLILLDIEMPVVNGFAFLADLKVNPQIIFISSKSEYALKAFNYNVAGYIQKPITHERFNNAVKRAVAFHELNQEAKENNHIFIKSHLRKLKICLNKIKWIESFGDYVKIITDKDINLRLCSMKSFENELPKEKFLRVHRSFIINIDKVERFNGKFAEIGLAKIPLSRNKKEDLLKALAIA
nr:LytTR family DNA-binding domain-containing protein [uncultured Flavobacterium sp.]